jgi:hypothetical protein
VWTRRGDFVFARFKTGVDESSRPFRFHPRSARSSGIISCEGVNGAVMFGLFKKRDDSGDFWVWLAANTSRIQTKGRKAVKDVSEELSAAFAKSFPDLVWEITPSQSGPWAFCVSADGNEQLFSKVQSAVADAPNIRGWRIDAFRQRGSLNAVIEMNGQRLGYDDIWCEVEADGSKARVTMCIRGLTLESAEAVLGASLVLLDNAVGEYDSVVKISELNNRPLTENPVKTGRFFPLSELPRYLDSLGQ